MANRWGIPRTVEEMVLLRDLNCVYCRIVFGETGKTRRTWEHITNDIRLNGPDNIALCCRSCNSSKGSKTLSDWLNSNYCKNKDISAESVAEVVRNRLEG
ncbi:MAG: HNH endonuclease [Bacteroidota bacterium]